MKPAGPRFAAPGPKIEDSANEQFMNAQGKASMRNSDSDRQPPPGQARTGQAPIGKVYIDCTITHRHDFNSGIQRVVRNLVNAAPAEGSALGITCQGVAFNRWRGFFPVGRLPTPAASPFGFIPPPTGFTRRLAARLKEVLNTIGVLSAVLRFKRWLRDLRYSVAGVVRSFFPAMQFESGDVLLLADLTWEFDFPWDDVRAARARGVRVGLIVYDLIPIQYPQTVPAEMHESFCRWWDTARSLVDFFVCISSSVVHDVEAVERLQPGPRCVPPGRVASFRLGAQLDGVETGGPVRDAVKAAFEHAEPRRTYLMVGWICERKNQMLAVEAFERLWAENSDVSLVVAGKYWWDHSDMVERLRSHPQFGKKLLWFEDLSDGEVDYCYRHTAGLITTSYAEGFNLPIVEALSRGCPVLASDVPVHREVGAPYAAFFPSGDSAALARLIAEHQQSGSPPGTRSLAGFSWPGWSESCRAMLARIVELSPVVDLVGNDVFAVDSPVPPQLAAHLKSAA